MNDFFWNAEEYREHSSVQLLAASELLKQVQLTGKEKVLDIGCGDGKISAEISRKLTLGNIIGIDLSPEMISFAKKMFPKESYPNLEFLIKDASRLEFNEEFDMLFSSFALQWVEDINSFFKGAYKSLKQGGNLVATIPLGISSALEKSIEEIISISKWSSYFRNFSPGWHFRTETEYKYLLSANNLKLKYFSLVQDETIFPSRKAFKTYVLQWFCYLNLLIPSLRPIFFKEIMDKYFEKEPLLPLNKVRFVFPRIDFIATKVSL